MTSPLQAMHNLSSLHNLSELSKFINYPFPVVVDQVAFLVSKEALPLVQTFMSSMGHAEWAQDRNVATGTVFGNPCTVTGELNFSYSFVHVKPTDEGRGVEFELLTYDDPVPGVNNDWHHQRAAVQGVALPPCKLSHLGFHVPDVDYVKQKLVQEAGLTIAQEVWTQSHSNPFLVKEGRKYHYLILDTEATLGYDLKFIQRIS